MASGRANGPLRLRNSRSELISKSLSAESPVVPRCNIQLEIREKGIWDLFGMTLRLP